MKAVIIKGNPKFIKDNPLAEKFYEEIEEFLKSLNFEVVVDAGEPFTSPPKADLWIGHSRGVDRLKFTKGDVKILAFGSATFGAINHPLDNTITSIGENNLIPNEYHYVFTKEMKESILDILNSIK